MKHDWDNHEGVCVVASSGLGLYVEAIDDTRLVISTCMNGIPTGPALVVVRGQFEMVARGWLEEYGAGEDQG